MTKEKNGRPGSFIREKKNDLIFAAIALVLIVVTVFLTVQYHSLKKERQNRPEEYGAALQEFNNVRNQKNELETAVDNAERELTEWNKKIAALSGN